MFQKIDQALLTAIPRPMHFFPWSTIFSRAVSQGRISRHLIRTVEQVTASVRLGHIPNAQWSSLSLASHRNAFSTHSRAAGIPKKSVACLKRTGDDSLSSGLMLVTFVTLFCK